ncbi:MAG: hypothetical protein IIY44_03830, partial [Erysipelotrichales bacterium]|nr:hypothetical protein [Erysipelotrichales bacterium]
EHKGLVAIAGYEMTWSGGPGHINSFNTQGLVSRNNAALNNKSGDAGMKLYYDTMIKDYNTIQQFNHPGNTFGNFTDFAYWTEEYDRNMFLVEVGNGEGQIGAGGYYPSYEEYDLALSKGWHVAPTNNQDNHKGRWGNANDARDVVLAERLTEEDIYNAIRMLRVYSTEDKNLEIDYTINELPMGTVFSEEDALESMNVVVTVFDPDKSDSISKVELIVENGETAYTWDNADQLAAGELTAELEPEHSYYYVKVTQKDGDLAVTAPIWVTKAAKVGVTEIKPADEKVYTGKEATLVTTLFNNEEKAATVKSLTYTVNGSEVIGTDTTERTLAAGGTLDVEFKHTFDAAKVTKVTVTAVIEYDGKEGSYIANVELDVIDEETENVVTPIADVRAASDPEDTGYRFVIEGVVTSNASGYDKDTAFFDCVYVQDETGGICVFPVSGEYKIGDKVHIVGHTDFYQGEPELQVQTIEIIGEGEVTPEEVTAKQIADREAEGKLVTLKGTIVSVEEANGLILAIIVKDANGDEARVFIDGYITTENEIKNAVVGNKITATGLASYDDTWADTDYLPRIRVRDRADVVCEEPLEAPVIIEHPESLTVRSGNEASFKVVAEGEDLQYQWYYRTSETGTWAKSTATCANTDTYTLPASSVISWRSGYQYRCEVKNSAGSVMSNEATLTVTKTPKPVIIEQPEDVTVRSGNEAVFKVVAEGEDLQYQWYYRTSETGTWAKSTATCANTDTYTVPASSVISWRDGYQYRCVVSTKGGYVISDTATLTVTKTPAPVITGQPQSVSAKPGTEVSFTVEAEGEDLKYQWYYRTSSTGTWAKSTSSCATEATYTLPGTSVVKKRNGYEYRCVVYNKGGNVISEAAVLKIVATANEVRPNNLFSVTAYGY